MTVPRRLRRVVIKEEFVALTGNTIRAIILGQLEYWQHRTHDIDRYVEEENARRLNHGASPDIEPLDGWIYKTASQLSEETFLGVSESTMRSHLTALVDHGWLLERSNPRMKWDRTKQYRLDLPQIAADLEVLGFHLQDWKFDPQPQDPRSSILEDGSSKIENGTSEIEEQYQRFPPEITGQRTGNSAHASARGSVATLVGVGGSLRSNQTTLAAREEQDPSVGSPSPMKTIPAWFGEWHALYVAANPDRALPPDEAYYALKGEVEQGKTRPTGTELIAALTRNVASDQWQKDDGKYVPNMRKYIHERQWERQAGPSSNPWKRDGFIYPIYVKGKGLTWPPGYRVPDGATQMSQVLDERGQWIPNPTLY